MLNCKKCKVYSECVASILNNDELKSFSAEVHRNTIKAGTVLFCEKQKDKKLFMIINGTVNIEYDFDLEEPLIVQVAKSADLLGIETLLKGNKYSRSGIALSETNYCEFSNQLINSVLIKNKDTCNFLLNKVIRTQERSYRDGIIRVLGTSESKVANSLITLCNSEGIVLIPKGKIAFMNGISRETVSRILSKFDQQNFIETKPRCIVIKNRLALNKLAIYMKGLS